MERERTLERKTIVIDELEIFFDFVNPEEDEFYPLTEWILRSFLEKDGIIRSLHLRSALFVNAFDTSLLCLPSLRGESSVLHRSSSSSTKQPLRRRTTKSSARAAHRNSNRRSPLTGFALSTLGQRNDGSTCRALSVASFELARISSQPSRLHDQRRLATSPASSRGRPLSPSESSTPFDLFPLDFASRNFTAARCDLSKSRDLESQRYRLLSSTPSRDDHSFTTSHRFRFHDSLQLQLVRRGRPSYTRSPSPTSQFQQGSGDLNRSTSRIQETGCITVSPRGVSRSADLQMLLGEDPP